MKPISWGRLLRILLLTAAFFLLCNLVYIVVNPLESLGRLSLYGTVFPLRPRFPTSEEPQVDYSVTTNNLSAMFAAHELSRPRAADEYRVVVLGDSGIWGWRLNNDETVTARLNALALLHEGRRVVFYNLGYPYLSITQQLLILDQALDCCQPDAVIAVVSADGLFPTHDAGALLLPDNGDRLDRLALAYGLTLPGGQSDEAEQAADLFSRSLVGQRRSLAALLRDQLLGTSWAATGIDQVFSDDYPPRANDLEADDRWHDLAPRALTYADLRFDILAAMADAVRLEGGRMLIVNQPIFIADGANSDLRYNAWYPRWAYDDYRRLMVNAASANGWALLDAWDALPPAVFTDSPVHFTPEGAQLLAAQIAARFESDDQ